ncbi:inositol monophosphatase family protein [Mycolicibacterium phlei]|jgi:myo-inositol-1(or 4)-monophosphatase
MSDTAEDPAALRTIAEQLATDAAAFARRRRAEVFGDAAVEPGVRTKSSPTDPVTVVDTETERLIRERLARLRPDDHILGEEEGATESAGGDGLTWVIDPIDGTVNFVYGLDVYAVSVGVQRDGASVAGAVINVPTGELYSAAVGHGAHVRRGNVTTPLRVSAAADLAQSLVGTGFSYQRDRRVAQAEVLARVLAEVRDMRRFGSCALDLCMVAAGQLDAYYEDQVKVWDWAAGALIASEAGAVVRLPTGEGTGGGPGFIVAAAPAIADAVTDLLQRAGAPL